MRTPSYSHSQGLWPLWVILPLVSSSVAAKGLPAGGTDRAIAVVIAVMLPVIALAVFGRLRIDLDASTLEWQFGYLGFPRWRLPLADIASVTPVRTGWTDGWGIHYRRGQGWLYNARGFDAVRIDKRDGSVVRLGTDEPERLVSFITARLPRRP
jgi:hypothetical protein